MFGGGELYSSFFDGRIVIFGWYTWGTVVQFPCNVDRYVQCDRLRRPCSFPNVILEDTRDIYTRDVQLIERKGIFNKTNHFERLGVSASHGSL
jgi:hypothetical protein